MRSVIAFVVEVLFLALIAVVVAAFVHFIFGVENGAVCTLIGYCVALWLMRDD